MKLMNVKKRNKPVLQGLEFTAKAIMELRFLPFIFKYNSEDKPGRYDEKVEFSLPLNIRVKANRAVNKNEFRIEEDELEQSSDGAYWFFINGVACEKSGLLSICDHLEELFGCKINYMYNKTNGLVWDMLEFYAGSVLNYIEYESVKSSSYVLSVLAKGHKVKIIAHSQGAVMAANVIRILAQCEGTKDLLSNVEVYTFGGSFDNFDTFNTNMHVEHFVNEKDFIARIGAIWAKNKGGALYKRKRAVGHLLSRNYLPAFVKKTYCGGNSKLYGYLKPEFQQ